MVKEFQPQKFKQIRKIKGFTQKEFGEMLGVSDGMIRQYELGIRKPKIETVEKIASALDVDIMNLYDESDRIIDKNVVVNEEYIPEINDRVKEVRKNLNLSQEEFGNSIGLSKSGISNIEKGTRNVTSKHIKLISMVFGIDETWLKTGIQYNSLKTSSINKDIVAMNIKFFRKKKKLKQKELAEMIGYTESSITKYEQGLTDIPITVINLIAKALDVSSVEILGISENQTSKALRDYSTKELLEEIERRCSQ